MSLAWTSCLHVAMNLFERVQKSLVRAAGALVALAGIGVIGFQVYYFLWNGTWVPASMLELLPIFPAKLAAWIRSPDSWFGMQKIVYGLLDAMPLSLFALIVGGMMMSFDAEVSRTNNS